MTDRRGIILAGGTGTRLHPSTISVSKQLMPVFDKPMIYYPLSVLMEAGIRDILIITTPRDQAAFEHLLGDGSNYGIRLSYAVQPSPDGLAQALIIAEDFLNGHPSALILGDNLFFGDEFELALRRAQQRKTGATVFGYHVSNPGDYGVVGFDADMNAVSLVEKPDDPASNYAVTGLYFYDDRAPALARTVTPSARGELEITALNSLYLDRGELSVELFGKGSTWLDTGTHRSLLSAAQFVGIIEERQGLRICCPEAVGWRKGWLSDDRLAAVAEPLKKSGYGEYLLTLLS
ncbi:glucose-1-phosphate thymidylyltransferase RfbA [uncultured Algimonas sp.]|uniref:glucose-1-phosphate thymidylyltransferase RfbA n=1 Tax=uncultured Algimonas sp. TaxID=1547920 RepID=UPI002631BCAB|nr:glucose-1-phosphate thymidylyltransferase RfbA [uncultured Algimonas sp.]